MKKGAGESRARAKAAMPVNVVQHAAADPSEVLQPAPPLTFGDPSSITLSRERGLRPKKSRKSRAAYLKPERKFSRHQPIWHRIEGEWKRYICRKCKSVTFVVVDEEELFVNIRCALGHNGKVLRGFAHSKPDG